MKLLRWMDESQEVTVVRIKRMGWRLLIEM